MALLLRVTTSMMVISSVLVFASTLAGQMADANIQTGNLEANGQHFTLFVEDIAAGLQVDLAGTRCFEPVPDWLCPDSEAFPVFEPPYSRFYLEKVTAQGLLARCR